LQALDNLNPRIHFLHNKSCLGLNNVRILGTTLWSHVPRTCSIDDEEAGVEDAFVNDHDTDCADPVCLWVHGHT
ncbi:unnamed protein product, partial [Rotaria socialis]